MTNGEAKAIFNDIKTIWAEFREVTPREQGFWFKYLVRLDKALVTKTIEKLYLERGEQQYDNLARLMPFFKSIYHSLVDDSLGGKPWCPCCGGTGFITLPGLEASYEAHKCHCRTGNAPHRRRCESQTCQNPEHKQTLRVYKGYHDKVPWEVLGYRQCKFNPVLTEVENFDLGVETKDSWTALSILHRAGIDIKRMIKPVSKQRPDPAMAAAND